MKTTNKAFKYADNIKDRLQIVIAGRHIGKLFLDAVLSEQHSSELKITENPVELGAEIADHSIVLPRKVSITGIVVDYELTNFSSNEINLARIRGDVNFLNKTLPAMFENGKKQAINLLERLSKINESKSSGKKNKREVGPWLLDDAYSLLRDYSEKKDRIGNIYDDFLALQKSGETIEINTGIKMYKNMLIESLSVSQTSDGFAEFSINAREIFIVKTKFIRGVNIRKNNPVNASGRAEYQLSDKLCWGTIPLKDKEDESFLYKIKKTIFG